MADLRIGAYEIVGRLGGGAMGTVHLARSPGGRLVAVKVARPELAEDPRFRERFRREIAMARAVGGFWTAAVVDADPDADQPWLATEYVPGPDLHAAVRSTGALPPDAVRGLAAGLAEALAAIHAAGLVHRDLKPSNVLLAADGPRVIDFGISKALEGAGLTHTGMVVGTPGYLSPEQIEGREVGPAADVFAFGAVVAYAASGRNPFGEGDTAALLYRAVHTRPDLRDVPPDLRDVVSRCLNRKAGARPTAPELVSVLGGRVADNWLPPAVRTIVDQRRTEIVAARPPTKVLPQDHLSSRARWWLERGDNPQPPGGPHPDPPRAGWAGRLRRLAGADQAFAGGAAGPIGHGPGGAGGEVGPAMPSASAGQAGPSAGAGSVGPGVVGSGRSPGVGAESEQHPNPVPRSASASASAAAAVAEPGVLGRWWQKALGRAQPVPAPEPEPKQPEQLADRVNRLVEQARDALIESERPRKPAPVRAKKLTLDRKATSERKPAAERKATAGQAAADRKVPDRKTTGNQAVFRTARTPRIVAAGVGLGGAALLGAAAAEASRTGQPGVGLLVFLVAVLLALVAVRRAGQAVRRRRGVEITAAGLSWRRGATVTTLNWPRVARVRIVEDKNQPWLVVWPRDPSALPGKPDHHGGYRVYPIAHEKRAATRAREIAELRAALSWYGRSAYDG